MNCGGRIAEGGLNADWQIEDWGFIEECKGLNRSAFHDAEIRNQSDLPNHPSANIRASSGPVSRVVHEGPAAYSSLVVLPDRSIGLLFERGDRSPYERITFVRLTLEWLRERKDKWR